MLQQTQVDRVIPFYERFLARFPTVGVLARAPLDEVLAAWRGLGYYSRARNLHAAAKQVLERHEGRLPSTVAGLLELPGFGRYTAGAVASIAHGLPAPLVDGNVARVFSRLFLVEGAPGERGRDALLWRLAELLVKGPRPGDFNQALMEHGATVCVPIGPRCTSCSVSRWCLALARGRVDELPHPKPRGRRQHLELAVALVRDGPRLLLARRPDTGLFGGLWELPSAPRSTSPPSTGAAALRALLGASAEIGPRLLLVERTLTHRELKLHVFAVTLAQRLPAALPGYVEWRWVPKASLEALGMSSAMQAVLQQLPTEA
jgi:A/G-specific adenine glycosylase